MNKLLKKIFKPIIVIFKFLISSFGYLLDNTIGLLFTKKYRRFNEQYKLEYKRWNIVRRVIIAITLLVLIFSFELIYKNSLGIVFEHAFILIGRFLDLGIFNNKLNSFVKILTEYAPKFSEGIGTTLYLSLIGTTIGLLCALILSNIVALRILVTDSKIIRFLKSLGKKVVNLYVTIVRGTPMMVQAMILYWGTVSFLAWDYKVAGLVVVSLNTTAYLTEVLRGGIEAVDDGQREGALSLGLSPLQTMFYVIFPQAIKNSMAAIGNEFVINIKDTAVLSSILVVDIYRVAELASGRYLDSFTPFIIAAAIYLVLTLSVSKILRAIEANLNLPESTLPSSN